MTKKSLQVSELSQIGLPDIFRPIVVGYTIGVTLMIWFTALIILVPSLILGGEFASSRELQSPWLILPALLFGLPISAAFQGALLAFLCSFGLAVYRRVF